MNNDRESLYLFKSVSWSWSVKGKPQKIAMPCAHVHIKTIIYDREKLLFRPAFFLNSQKSNKLYSRIFWAKLW